MIKALYKRIVRKLGLPVEQLKGLQAKLKVGNICSGPFIEGEKMCPNTTALAMKEGRVFGENKEVRALLNEYGISNGELRLFYLLFDAPAMISRKLFERMLGKLREGVGELIHERVQTKEGSS